MPLRDPQRSVRMLWYVANRCFDVSVFEKLRFHPSTRQHEHGVFQKIHSDSGECFEKLPFGDRKRRLRVDANPKRIKKMRLQKYPDTCGRGLSCTRRSFLQLMESLRENTVEKNYSLILTYAYFFLACEFPSDQFFKTYRVSKKNCSSFIWLPWRISLTT